MNPHLRPVLETVGLDDALRYFVRLHGVQHVAERLASTSGDAGIWEMLVRRYPDARDRELILDALSRSFVPPPVAAPSEWWLAQREEAVHAER